MGDETTNKTSSEFGAWLNNVKAKAASAALGFFGHAIDNTVLQRNLKKSAQPQHKRRILYKAKDGNLFYSRADAIRHNAKLTRLTAGGYLTKGIVNKGKPNQGYSYVQRTPNTSSTSTFSTDLENTMLWDMYKSREANNYRTKKYDIPYGDRVIRVKPRGSTISYTIPVNALDTIAKYAGREKASMTIPLGLADHESKWGKQPFLNYINGEPEYNKALANANYFKAFGSIPAENLVRDFRYNDEFAARANKAPQYIDLNIHPIQHAIRYFLSGDYNRGEKGHTNKVLKAGDNLWNESTGSLRDWWLNEGKAWYEGKNDKK